jgi:hypothetical protein
MTGVLLLIPHVTFAVQRTKIAVQPQNDFVVEPGKTEIFLNPGEHVVKNVTITSRISRTTTFHLTTEDLVGSSNPQETIKLLGDERGPYSLKDFIKPEISEFTLELGERITIPVTISVPLDAEPRGYYGALIIANQPMNFDGTVPSEAEGKTRIVSRIGSLFLMRVNGKGTESGKLEDFKIIGPDKLFYEKRPEGFEIAYNNTGNVHLVPYGTITIKNMLGRVVEELPVNAYFVLPDSIRYRQIVWDKGFGLGRYTANLSLYQGYGNENATAKIAFWILPWKILLGIFVALVLIVAFFYYFATRFELRKK